MVYHTIQVFPAIAGYAVYVDGSYAHACATMADVRALLDTRYPNAFEVGN